MVRALKNLKGKNSVESVPFTVKKSLRYIAKWLVVSDQPVELGRQDPCPFWMDPDQNRMFSGSAYFIFTKKAIQAILTDLNANDRAENLERSQLSKINFGKSKLLFEHYFQITVCFILLDERITDSG